MADHSEAEGQTDGGLSFTAHRFWDRLIKMPAGPNAPIWAIGSFTALPRCCGPPMTLGKHARDWACARRRR
jgi:hypothetical protein